MRIHECFYGEPANDRTGNPGTIRGYRNIAGKAKNLYSCSLVFNGMYLSSLCYLGGEKQSDAISYN